jgi:hypothetical protein
LRTGSGWGAWIKRNVERDLSSGALGRHFKVQPRKSFLSELNFRILA